MGRQRQGPRCRSPLIDEFAASLRINALGTARAYPADVEAFARFHGATTPSEIDDLLERTTTSHVRRWSLGLSDIPNLGDDEEARRQRDRRNRLISRKLSGLASFFRYQIAMERREDNPVEGVPRPPRSKRLPHVININEVHQVLSVHPERGQTWQIKRDDAILQLLYGSGLRRAELVGLDLQHIDIVGKTAHVFGKGSKDRVVDLTDPCVSALAAYLDVRPARFKGKSKGDIIDRSAEEALFVSREGRRLSTRQVHEIFRRRKKASALDRRATPHTLRHACATHMIERGADLETVRQLLGHESLQTTQIYVNISREHRRKTHERTHPANSPDWDSN